MWDTAGQERFSIKKITNIFFFFNFFIFQIKLVSLSVSYFRGCDCCMLVYDVNKKESFEKLEDWLEMFYSNTRK
jgi:GTPase SAR1 family protein